MLAISYWSICTLCTSVIINNVIRLAIKTDWATNPMCGLTLATINLRRVRPVVYSVLWKPFTGLWGCNNIRKYISPIRFRANTLMWWDVVNYHVRVRDGAAVFNRPVKFLSLSSLEVDTQSVSMRLTPLKFVTVMSLTLVTSGNRRR